MNFDHSHYVPCLRWKMGEYQAVWRLSARTKEMFTPLIEIPEIGWDFEEGRDIKTVDEHLIDFAQKKIYRKWGTSCCFVDLKLIDLSKRLENGIHPLKYVFDDLRKVRCSAIPVTGIDRNNAYQQEIKNVVTQDKSGICLRIKIEQAARGSLKDDLDSLLSRLKVKPEICDLILDLDAPNFIPLEGFSKAIQGVVSSFLYLNDWRTFSILGTSFPETMASIKKGGEIIPRHEWRLYKMLVANFREAGLRLPSFGDYAISHPKVFELDMRIVKPYATIRYTIDDRCYVVKGDNVRDYGYEQYHELSQKILASSYYCGPTLSWGDDYIQTCANKNAKTGNLTTWRQVGTNHHIEKVVQDIANFYASVNTA
jgi:hypothetical protein